MSLHHNRPPEEWEMHRSDIRRLYIDEDNTLQHVMTTMSQKGFEATTKMYKNKLKSWKFFKNNRAADVAAILRSQSQRTVIGKDSIAMRNGRRVDMQTYLKRKGVSAEDLLKLAAMSSGGDLPAHLRCMTPPPSDPMTGILGSSPGWLGIKEIVGKWVLSECEKLGDGTGNGMMVDSGIGCETPEEKERPLLVYYESAASKIVAAYYDAIWLLQKSRSPQGWALANSVFSRLHMLLDNSERLLYPILNLLMVILTLPSNTTTEIHRKLWDYLSSHALIRFGSTHPVQRMLGQLRELFDEGGDEDDKFGLINSIVSDAMSHLGKKLEDDEGSSGRAYYDLASLWYAETLRSHRGHRCGFRPQLDIEQEDICSILDDLAPAMDEAGAPYLLLNSTHSYLLLDYGWQTSWQDFSVYSSCVDLLNAKEDISMPADETEVNCLTAMALFHRAQCDAETHTSTACATDTQPEIRVVKQQHHELARHLLQEAISLDWELSGASIYNVEGLLLLQEWCSEAEDWPSLEAARQRSEMCLQILFGEWGV